MFYGMLYVQSELGYIIIACAYSALAGLQSTEVQNAHGMAVPFQCFPCEVALGVSSLRKK